MSEEIVFCPYCIRTCMFLIGKTYFVNSAVSFLDQVSNNKVDIYYCEGCGCLKYINAIGICIEIYRPRLLDSKSFDLDGSKKLKLNSEFELEKLNLF